ncbi:MAG TPA: BolA family protein [Xanthomonadales bacterium]|nr:BolA family protein [Xanthomonadales bacterium]
MSPAPEVTARRIAQMRQRLQQALQPEILEIADESHHHVGHAGARDGRGHFRLHVVSAAFSGLSPLQRHRLVYAALGELMQTDIHALAIEAELP